MEVHGTDSDIFTYLKPPCASELNYVLHVCKLLAVFLTVFIFQALCQVGQFMAGALGLRFSKDGLQHKEVERSRPAQEPWRSLYL